MRAIRDEPDPVMKYLLLLAIVLGVWWLSRAARARLAGGKGTRGRQAATPVGHEDLPACAECGVYLPRSEALPGSGRVFCGEAHRQAFIARTPSQ